MEYAKGYSDNRYLFTGKEFDLESGVFQFEVEKQNEGMTTVIGVTTLLILNDDNVTKAVFNKSTPKGGNIF